ncbi:hypothetical protein [Naumannella huperziae]
MSFSDLNLNGPTPARVRPKLGEWGPTEVPGTKAKRRQRRLVPFVFAAALLMLFLTGWLNYSLMTGRIGFGLDPLIAP